MTPRRGFLKRAGAGLAGTVLTAGMGGRLTRAAELAGAFDVKAFGAKGDGTTIDSPAINKAIEAAAAAGGGTVVFPAGNYLCYSIRLKSNVALYLEEGSTVIAADTP